MRFPEASSPFEDIANRLWPVGVIVHLKVATNPGVLFGIGTWQLLPPGVVVINVDPSDANLDAAGKAFGTKTVTLSVAQMPAHTHVQDSHNHTQDPHTHVQNAHNHVQNCATTATGPLVGSTPDASTNTSAASGYSTANTTAVNQNATATNQAATATNQSTGGGGSHNNMQPSVAAYVWERIA